MFGTLYTLFSGRSPKWPALRRHHLLLFPLCANCDADENLDVHHCDPVSWKPERELDADNLLTLCRRCHLLIGHLDDWNSFNPFVEIDAATNRRKIRNRPRRLAGQYGF